jgi:hypothetical protein
VARFLSLTPGLVELVLEVGRARAGVVSGVLGVGQRDGQRGGTGGFDGLLDVGEGCLVRLLLRVAVPGGVFAKRGDGRLVVPGRFFAEGREGDVVVAGCLVADGREGGLVIANHLLLPADDRFVALALELGAEVGQLRVALVLELRPEGDRGRVVLPLHPGPELLEGGVALALEFGAERVECGLVVGGRRVERRLGRLVALLGGDGEHIGEEAVKRLLDRALDFVDYRFGQALDAIVERHKVVRPVPGRYTRTLVGRIGCSRGRLQGGGLPTTGRRLPAVRNLPVRF